MLNLSQLSFTYPEGSQGGSPERFVNNGRKHMAIGHLLPDFSLQNTCKFVVQIRRLDHRIGQVSHAEKHQSPQAPFPSDTLEHGL
jgi:hypothetical protein